MTDGGPQAGWYDDPDDPTRYRYWDGAAWTEHRASKTTEPPSAAGPYHDSNAGWALGLSIAGILCCGLLSIPGFVMGMRELKAYREGLISPSDRGMALAAAIIGGVVIALFVVFVLIAIVFVLVGGDPGPAP